MPGALRRVAAPCRSLSPKTAAKRDREISSTRSHRTSEAEGECITSPTKQQDNKHSEDDNNDSAEINGDVQLQLNKTVAEAEEEPIDNEAVTRKREVFAQRINDMAYPYGFTQDGSEVIYFGLLVKTNGNYAYILTRFGMLQFKALCEVDEYIRGAWVKCRLQKPSMTITEIVDVVVPPIHTRLLSKQNNHRRIWIYDYLTMTSTITAFSDFLGMIELPGNVETYNVEENGRFSAEYMILVPEGITRRYIARVLKIHGSVLHQAELPEELMIGDVLDSVRYGRSPSFYIEPTKRMMLTAEQRQALEEKRQKDELKRYYKQIYKDAPHLIVGPVMIDDEENVEEDEEDGVENEEPDSPKEAGGCTD